MQKNLNLLIATQVMEWEIYTIANECTYSKDEWARSAVYRTKDGKWELWANEWNPSTNMADASMVIQKLELDGFPLQQLFKQLEHLDKLCVADLPRAICEIALQISHSSSTR